LQAAGLRPTSARLLLLETLYENDSFHDVETLYRDFSKCKTPIRIGAIYRALRDMHNACLLLRVWGMNRSVHYRFRHGAEAPLFIMRRDDHSEMAFSDPDLYAHILSAAAREGLDLSGRAFDLHIRLERCDAGGNEPSRHGDTTR
jgi:Fe2+ or Zn2+ uptake regulation protein